MESTAKLRGARISFKKSYILSKELRGMKAERAIRFLTDLVDEKVALDGKFYTKTARVFLDILKSAEANAKQKNLDTEKLFVKVAKTDKARKLVTPKSRFKFRGRQAKTANIEIVLQER